MGNRTLPTQHGSPRDDRDLRGAVHVSKIVRKHLTSNGDWNVNDWKDAADALSGFILRFAAKDSE